MGGVGLIGNVVALPRQAPMTVVEKTFIQEVESEKLRRWDGEMHLV